MAVDQKATSASWGGGHGPHAPPPPWIRPCKQQHKRFHQKYIVIQMNVCRGYNGSSVHPLICPTLLLFSLYIHFLHAIRTKSCSFLFEQQKGYEWCTLRASSCGNLVVPRRGRRICDRAFSVAAPRAWNRLPTELKLLRSTDSFRRDLKTFLFDFRRRDSMTSIFMELSLPTFNTVVHNSRVLFQNQLTRSTNSIVQWLAMLNVWYLFVTCVFLLCILLHV